MTPSHWNEHEILDRSEAVRTELIAQGVLDNSAVVVIAGPANTYGHYIATPEEYTVQRYEGASTLYGPRAYLSLPVHYMRDHLPILFFSSNEKEV